MFIQMKTVSPKPPGGMNTREGKKKIFERTKVLLDNATMIMAFDVHGVSNSQVWDFKKALPPGTRSAMIKNAILRKSVENSTAFHAMTGDKLKHETMYLFLPDHLEAKKVLQVYKEWREDVQRTDAKYDMKFAAMEGSLFEGKAIDDVAKLPSRETMIAKIVQMLKRLPQRLLGTLELIPDASGQTVRSLREQQMKDEAAAAAAGGGGATATAPA
jgi:ribosomal protein L10